MGEVFQEIQQWIEWIEQWTGWAILVWALVWVEWIGVVWEACQDLWTAQAWAVVWEAWEEWIIIDHLQWDLLQCTEDPDLLVAESDPLVGDPDIIPLIVMDMVIENFFL